MMEWVHECREQALEVIKTMERSTGGRLSVHAFKCMEQLRDPEDLHKVCTEMEDATQKPTASRLKSVVATLARQRWWIWLIMHPGLSPLEIHPSKSMPLPNTMCHIRLQSFVSNP